MAPVDPGRIRHTENGRSRRRGIASQKAFELLLDESGQAAARMGHLDAERLDVITHHLIGHTAGRGPGLVDRGRSGHARASRDRRAIARGARISGNCADYFATKWYLIAIGALGGHSHTWQNLRQGKVAKRSRLKSHLIKHSVCGGCDLAVFALDASPPTQHSDWRSTACGESVRCREVGVYGIRIGFTDGDPRTVR
jgi:hypothetical protein